MYWIYKFIIRNLVICPPCSIIFYPIRNITTCRFAWFCQIRNDNNFLFNQELYCIYKIRWRCAFRIPNNVKLLVHFHYLRKWCATICGRSLSQEHRQFDWKNCTQVPIGLKAGTYPVLICLMSYTELSISSCSYLIYRSEERLFTLVNTIFL